MPILRGPRSWSFLVETGGKRDPCPQCAWSGAGAPSTPSAGASVPPGGGRRLRGHRTGEDQATTRTHGSCSDREGLQEPVRKTSPRWRELGDLAHLPRRADEQTKRQLEGVRARRPTRPGRAQPGDRDATEPKALCPEGLVNDSQRSVRASGPPRLPASWHFIPSKAPPNTSPPFPLSGGGTEARSLG